MQNGFVVARGWGRAMLKESRFGHKSAVWGALLAQAAPWQCPGQCPGCYSFFVKCCHWVTPGKGATFPLFYSLQLHIMNIQLPQNKNFTSFFFKGGGVKTKNRMFSLICRH
jgi:hypothetical protein